MHRIDAKLKDLDGKLAGKEASSSYEVERDCCNRVVFKNLFHTSSNKKPEKKAMTNSDSGSRLWLLGVEGFSHTEPPDSNKKEPARSWAFGRV